MRFVKPLDEQLLHRVFQKYQTVITVEDGIIKGGFGSAILEFASENKYQNNITVLGIPDEFIPHGSIFELHKQIGLDAFSLSKVFKNLA
jgi:1-deoxy-D-xylulose-5-phosphate synthase